MTQCEKCEEYVISLGLRGENAQVFYFFLFRKLRSKFNVNIFYSESLVGIKTQHLIQTAQHLVATRRHKTCLQYI